MWKFIKGLFRGKNKKIEEVIIEEPQSSSSNGIYIQYPKTPYTPRPPRRREPQRVHTTIPTISIAEWLQNCKEERELRNRLFA